MEYSLRPAVDADFDFLYNLNRVALQEYIEPIWGWHEEWQAHYFRAKFNTTNRQIIEVDGRSVGVIVVEERPEEVYLGLLELLPEFQKRGIGTRLLKQLIERAETTSRALTLHVLKTNHPARRLYERNGFQVVEEEDVRFRMSYQPAPSQKGVTNP